VLAALETRFAESQTRLVDAQRTRDAKTSENARMQQKISEQVEQMLAVDDDLVASRGLLSSEKNTSAKMHTELEEARTAVAAKDEQLLQLKTGSLLQHTSTVAAHTATAAAHTATHCNCCRLHCNTVQLLQLTLQHSATAATHTATYCNCYSLRRIVYCNTLQHTATAATYTATHCNCCQLKTNLVVLTMWLYSLVYGIYVLPQRHHVTLYCMYSICM